MIIQTVARHMGQVNLRRSHGSMTFYGTHAYIEARAPTLSTKSFRSNGPYFSLRVRLYFGRCIQLDVGLVYRLP